MTIPYECKIESSNVICIELETWEYLTGNVNTVHCIVICHMGTIPAYRNILKLSILRFCGMNKRLFTNMKSCFREKIHIIFASPVLLLLSVPKFWEYAIFFIQFLNLIQ